MDRRPRIDVDRLSDLPDPLISHILSFLPIKMFVATSILSTRWKPLWKTVPSIEFRYAQSSSSPAKFVQNVNIVIMLRNPEILDKVLLEGPVASEEDAVCVNTWLRYAIPKNLRSLHLTLQTRSPKLNIEIPKDLLKCATLESLKLLGPFTFQLSNDVVRLPRLEMLNLVLRRVSNEFINNIVSGCPVLRSVKIYRKDGNKVPDTDLKISSPSIRSLTFASFNIEKLEIDAPNLEFLYVYGYCCMKVPSRSLNRVALLIDWHCCADSNDDNVDGRYNIDSCNSTVKLVNALNRAKHLSLDGYILNAISNATIPLSARFERLTSLNVNVPCCSWSSLNLVLSCCIKLQRFSMSTDLYDKRSCGGTDHKRCWKDPEEVPQCLVSSLSFVSLKTFRGLEDEMSMVRYFLEHGSVLESVNVSAHSSVVSANKLQAISRLPRLSSTCLVKFD